MGEHESVEPAAPEAPATVAAREIVTALVASGVRDVVLAPGSRSAPLAYALLAAERAGWLNLHVRIDERSAGFLALGIAMLRPAAVVTTSGTAVANLHPAVLEASHANRPLVVISADRPHEMRGVGANQTTQQVGIFGAAVRWAGEIPASDASSALARNQMFAAPVQRAVSAARGLRTGHPGPVHLNVAFREPLTPRVPWAIEASLASESESESESEAMPQPSAAVAPAILLAPTHQLARGPRTVVVAGDGAGPAAADLAEAGGWPLLAEPTSGARAGSTAIAAYRVLLGEPTLGARIERVIVFGRPTLSRPVSRLLARSDVEIVVVSPRADWVDVAGTARHVVTAVSVAAANSEAAAAAAAAAGAGADAGADGAWLALWREASAAATAALTEADARKAAGAAPLDGPTIARAVLSAEGGAAVVLGSSMAIRDADLAAPVGTDYTGARVLANRGLAGIDGTLATAAGYALATGAPVRTLVGDLTLQHDLGGLARGPLEREIDLQVIVLNDDGGSIFAHLEHGEPAHADDFARVFGTPQGLDFAALAAGFGVTHTLVRSTAELATVLAAPVRGRSVVEIRLEAATARGRAENLTAAIQATVRSAVGS